MLAPPWERGSKKWKENQRVEFLKEIKVLCWCLYGYVLPLLYHYWYNNKAEWHCREEPQKAFRILFLCEVFWHAVAISVELGGSTSSLCLSVSDCSSPAVQGWVSLAWGLCCRACPGKRLGVSWEGDWETPAFQWWTLLVTRSALVSLVAFWLWHFICLKFELELTFSFGICQVTPSSVTSPALLPLLYGDSSAPTASRGDSLFLLSSFPSPIPWKGQGHDTSSVHFQDCSYTGHLCLCRAAGTAERRGHLCQQWQPQPVKIHVEVPIVRISQL